MLKFIALVLTGLLLPSGLVFAQSSTAPSKPPDLTLVPQEARPLYLDASPEDLTKIQNDARELARQITSSMKVTPTKSDLETAAKSMPILRSGTAIANQALAADRDAVLKALGIDLNKAGSLYVFVSKSMPESLLRSYMKEGMWAGAQLVVRGIPDHQDIGEYLKEQVLTLVQNKGAGAVLTIDPRLFDAYDIDIVPTIVYSEWNELTGLCLEQAPVPMADSNLTYTRCGKAPPNSYWKVSGAVNIAWALTEFEGKGASNVKAFKSAMARGPSKSSDGKVQVPYEGNWAAEASVEETNLLRAQANAIVGNNPGLRVIETSRGPAVGAKILEVMPEKDSRK